jgi:nucleotide-binding universal stress UspA family protein
MDDHRAMAQQTIVVGIDGSEGSRAALSWACEEAQRQAGTKIVAVSSWMSSLPAASSWVAGYDLPRHLSEATAAELEASVAAVTRERFPDIDLEQRVLSGSASAVLIDQGTSADLLVVGSRGLGGFKGLLLGSVSQQVVTHAPCPTVIVPLRDEQSDVNSGALRSIVVGVDGSPNSIAALQWAAHRARKSETVLRAVYGWQTSLTAVVPIGTGIPETFIKAAADALAGFIVAADLPDGIHAMPISREGSPARVLVTEGRQADLLVVGARGREGFVGLLLGSVASAVAQNAPCPVAVIPVK